MSAGDPFDLAGEPLGQQPPEQLAYARLLEAGTRVGLALLVLAFAAYGSGLAPAWVKPADLPRLWGLPLADYLRATQVPTGWRWLAAWRHADLASLAGIAVLAASSVASLLAIVPAALRHRDRITLLLCLAQLGVMAVAVTGIAAPGR